MNNKRTSSRGDQLVLAVAVVFTCIALLTPTQVSAQFYVRQPNVEKGVSEVEEHGAVYVSPGDDEDLRQSHEVEFKRGLTDRAQLIVEGFFEQPIGESLQFKEFEIGGQYELIKPQGEALTIQKSLKTSTGRGFPACVTYFRSPSSSRRS